MKQNIIAEITISECPGGRGLWFDHGELDAVKDEVSPDMRWLEVDTWKEQAEFKDPSDPNFYPKCRDVTLTTVQDLHSATKISLCTRCKGAWLSTGQFLNLINALLDEANQKSAPEFVKICLQQAKEMLTRPNSVISEWEDLKTILELLEHLIFIQHPKLKSPIFGLQKSLPL
jgi:Zn-finger nucleic acid-binding protein